MFAPTPYRLFLSFLGLSALLFLRPPWTNFIFDEQEAILANPYLRGEVPFLDVLRVDFWGLPKERTIGSYRPLPDLLWRTASWSLRLHTPWVFSLFNLVVHAGTSAVLARAVLHAGQALERDAPFASATGEKPRLSSEGRWDLAAFLTGFLFCATALSTEAVSGVVGLADLLVGFFAALCLLTLVRTFWGKTPSLREQIWSYALCGFLVFFGMLSKETMLVVPLLLFLVLLLGPSPRPGRQFVSALLVALSSALGVIGFVLLRRHFYPTGGTELSQIVTAAPGAGMLRALLQWFGQPPLPHDPMNNPLIGTSATTRLLSAAQIFLEQTSQLVFPYGLRGDYSFPRQLPSKVSALSLLGVATCVLSAGLVAWVALRKLLFAVSGRRPVSQRLGLLALTLGWSFFAFLPVSGALVLLPTIRADRLFYLPTLGVWFGLGLLLLREFPSLSRLKQRVWLLFFALQCVSSRLHALDYTSDVTFWRATSQAFPESAKAHLNYGVMMGARGDLDARLAATKRAVELAPSWAMGRIYLGDTYCRRKEARLAEEQYLQGLALAPNSKALTSLALQCLYEMGGYPKARDKLFRVAESHEKSWLAYFLYELDEHGEANGGLPKEHRARRYNSVRYSASQK